MSILPSHCCFQKWEWVSTAFLTNHWVLHSRNCFDSNSGIEDCYLSTSTKHWTWLKSTSGITWSFRYISNWQNTNVRCVLPLLHLFLQYQLHQSQFQFLMACLWANFLEYMFFGTHFCQRISADIYAHHSYLHSQLSRYIFVPKECSHHSNKWIVSLTCTRIEAERYQLFTLMA